MLHNNSTDTSIIISVYKCHVALDLILQALNKQSISNFEIIVSADGHCNEITQVVDKWAGGSNNITHLNQKDDGFRKNRASNRAIKNSNSDHLVFIDGDCIPHPKFVAAHQTCEEPGKVCAGRRVEPGPSVLDEIRSGALPLEYLFNSLSYLLLLPRLLKDNVEHSWQRVFAKFMQRFTLNRPIKILGCNFSCSKQDPYKTNGFNEDFIAAGRGEDNDIEWRLKKSE